MTSHAPFKECLPSRRNAVADAPALMSRMPLFIGLKVMLEAVVCNLHIAIFGVGSVGMRIAENLARLRVAGLWLVDPQKVFKPESLLTHPISQRFKQPKATVTARLCKAISPGTRVFSYVGRVQDLPFDALANVHIGVMATDNLPAEADAGQRFLHLGKRLVHASLHGESLTAQVRVFANADGQGPCPICAFGAAERRLLNDQIKFSCDGSMPDPAAFQTSGPPTRSPSHLCSTASDLATNQILRLALKLGDSVEDSILEYCGITNQMVTGRLERDPICPCDHVRYTLERAPSPLRGYSIEKLAKELGFNPSDSSLTLRLGGVCWVEKGHCACPEPVLVQRFVAEGQTRVGRCPRCRSTLHIQPFYAHETVTPPGAR